MYPDALLSTKNGTLECLIGEIQTEEGTIKNHVGKMAKNYGEDIHRPKFLTVGLEKDQQDRLLGESADRRPGTFKENASETRVASIRRWFQAAGQ